MPKALVFDMGGVVFALSHLQAVERFEEIGVSSARELLNPYHQVGLFGELEKGAISQKEFIDALSETCGKRLTFAQCEYAWRGFIEYVASDSLDYIRSLKESGYRTLLLSNTNAFITSWGRSDEFDGRGHSMMHYFDNLYFSCECKVMKPDAEIFNILLRREGLEAGDCVFVDDSAANVAAASALGFGTILAPDALSWPPLLEDYLKKN